MTRFHLHLVSDATGDTVHSVARACLVQFEGADAVEHIWSMVRTKAQIDRVVSGVAAHLIPSFSAPRARTRPAALISCGR